MSEKTDGGARDEGATDGPSTDWSQIAQRYYEPNGQGELTTAIVYAIAEAEGVDATEVRSPPLYEVVDVPAIENAFFGPSAAGAGRQGVGSVEFHYTDYLVKVRSDGWVQVYEPDHS